MLRKLQFNETRAEKREGMTMSWRESDQGVMYLEWRMTPYSRKPVAVRRARDTEIELIRRIQALEAQLANPNAPRPVADLKLRPFVYRQPPKPLILPED